MDEAAYIELLSDDKARALRVPLRWPDEGCQGYHDDERLIFWGYDENGDLFNAQDTLHGRELSPPKPAPVSRELRSAASLAYFIQAETGQIKIGLAKDPRERLRTLQTGSPVALRLLAFIAGGYDAEQGYHARFAAHRLHGEWFAPHPDILAEITRLAPHDGGN